MKKVIIFSSVLVSILFGGVTYATSSENLGLYENGLFYNEITKKAEVAIDTTFDSAINDWSGYKIDIYIRANAAANISKGDQIELSVPETDLIEYQNARFGGTLKSGNISAPYFSATYSKEKNTYVITFDKDLNRYEAMNIQITLPSSREFIKQVDFDTSVGQITATYNKEVLSIPNKDIIVAPTNISFNRNIQLGHGFPKEAVSGLPTDFDNHDNGKYFIPYKKQYTFSGFINGNGYSTESNVMYTFKSNDEFTHNNIDPSSFKISTEQGIWSDHSAYVPLNGYKGAEVIQQSNGKEITN